MAASACAASARVVFRVMPASSRARSRSARSLPALGGRRSGAVEVAPDPLDHERESALGFQGVVGAVEQPVYGVDRLAQRRVGEVGAVDRGADQVLADHAGVEVDDPLAEPAAGGGPAVVHHVRRQDGDLLAPGAVRLAVEVVADRPVVHDQQRPGVVGVGRVDVLGEAGVEHLADPGHGRLPGPDLVVSRHRWHTSTVAPPALCSAPAEATGPAAAQGRLALHPRRRQAPPRPRSPCSAPARATPRRPGRHHQTACSAPAEPAPQRHTVRTSVSPSRVQSKAPAQHPHRPHQTNKSLSPPARRPPCAGRPRTRRPARRPPRRRRAAPAREAHSAAGTGRATATRAGPPRAPRAGSAR